LLDYVDAGEPYLSATSNFLKTKAGRKPFKSFGGRSFRAFRAHRRAAHKLSGERGSFARNPQTEAEAVFVSGDRRV
jgi:hypothetical protein